LISCSSETERASSSDRELVPYTEKYEHEGYTALPDSAKPKFNPDTTIGQISLINSQNVDSYIGSDIMNKLVDKGLPQTSILSADKKQKLTIYFHPGSVRKEFSPIERASIARSSNLSWLAANTTPQFSVYWLFLYLLEQKQPT